MNTGDVKHPIRQSRTADIVESHAPKEVFKNGMFQFSADGVVHELGTKQICLVMRALLAFHLYAKKDGQIAEFLLTFFRDKFIPVANVKGGRYIKRVLED